jgi:hypothetical protein
MSGISGKWDVTVSSPMGAQKSVLILNESGGALTGKLEGAQGALEIKNGKASGEDVSWAADMTQPMPITLEFSGKVQGDAISGNVKLGAFGSATFSGTRIS